jgi:S-DNA-T family DNA segregation ATPase FtsK/SpoIIIE
MTDTLPEAYDPGPIEPDDPIDLRLDDAESYVHEPNIIGGPVDAEPEPAATLYGTILAAKTANLVPIIPAWLRSRDQRTAFARQFAGLVLYLVLLHSTRSPKYGIKLAIFAPWGALVVLGRLLRWAWHPTLTALEQTAARKGDLDHGGHLARQAGEHRKVRFTTLGVGLVGASGLIAAAQVFAPPWWPWAALAVAVPILARIGRPADKPIIDRTVDGPRFTRLTAEMVRRALVDISIPGIKDPGQLKFPAPGIHREGPGWLARVDLPPGVLASQVMEKRESLSSALRLPVDQIWPDVGPDHKGQLDLWVGYMPSSKMGQPTWDLTRRNARTSVFEPAPFATDARQRVISTALFETNYLLAGQPGSGKTYAARTLATIALLDPTCELKIAEFKGVGDFLDFAPFCSTYVVGVDDEAFEAGRDIIAWALAEARRRGERVLAAKKRGEAPLGKVTPELSARKGSGLHPVFILLDEIHEVFVVCPEAAEDAERAIKRLRALNIFFVLATQIPDKSSLPPNIVRCVTIRWALSLGGQMENDMVLGTGAYKAGLSATVYRPKIDAGWGIIKGLAKPGSYRSMFPSEAQTKAIFERAAELRGTTVVTGADEQKVRARNMLADAWSVLLPGESGMPWDVLAQRLAEQWPEFYEGLTADMARETLARYDVPTQDVKVGRRNIKGARRTALDAALHPREIDDEPA